MEHEPQLPLDYESKQSAAREPPEHEYQTITEALVRAVAWFVGLILILNGPYQGYLHAGLLCILIAEVIRLRATLRRLLGDGKARR